MSKKISMTIGLDFNAEKDVSHLHLEGRSYRCDALEIQKQRAPVPDLTAQAASLYQHLKPGKDIAVTISAHLCDVEELKDLPWDFTLDDFVTAKYQDLPQYLHYPGIEIELIHSLHRSKGGLESEGQFYDRPDMPEHAWFMHVEDLRFDLYIYDVNSWTMDFAVRTVDPFVYIHGTTFDGVRATWFSNTESCDLKGMSDALRAAHQMLEQRGWCL